MAAGRQRVAEEQLKILSYPRFAERERRCTAKNNEQLLRWSGEIRRKRVENYVDMACNVLRKHRASPPINGQLGTRFVVGVSAQCMQHTKCPGAQGQLRGIQTVRGPQPPCLVRWPMARRVRHVSATENIDVTALHPHAHPHFLKPRLKIHPHNAAHERVLIRRAQLLSIGFQSGRGHGTASRAGRVTSKNSPTSHARVLSGCFRGGTARLQSAASCGARPGFRRLRWWR